MNLGFRMSLTIATATTGLATLTAAYAAPADSAGRARAAAPAMVRVKVVADDRAGHSVAASGMVSGGSAFPVRNFLTGHPFALVPGTYLFSADIPTANPDSTVSQTLVARRIVIHGTSQVVTLSARGGVRVRLSLDVPGAQPAQDDALLCSGTLTVGFAGQGADPLYVVPLRSPGPSLLYGAQWTGPAGAPATYDVMAKAKATAPRSVGFHAAGLARLSYQLRGDAVPDGYRTLMLVHTGSCDVFFFADLGQPSGFSEQAYVTPGRWTTTLFGNGNSNDSWDVYGRYRAGRKYERVLGGAVFAPTAKFPGLGSPSDGLGDMLTLDFLGGPFADPRADNSAEYYDVSHVVLTRRGRILRTFTTDLRHDFFQAKIPRRGWYDLSVDSRRGIGAPLPPGTLSTRATLAWHFYARPVPDPSGRLAMLPVTVTKMMVRGLSLANQAPAGGQSVVRARIMWPVGYPGAVPFRPLALRSVRFQASGDDGKTWHAVTGRRSGDVWLVTVTNPASGFVSLRSIVTDVRGDRTIETVYRAYAIG